MFHDFQPNVQDYYYSLHEKVSIIDTGRLLCLIPCRPTICRCAFNQGTYVKGFINNDSFCIHFNQD
jgi:hypothetical protein